MNEYKLFGQRIGLIGIVNLLVSISGILLVPILTKNITAEDYGVWVQVTVTISFIATFAPLGIG